MATARELIFDEQFAELKEITENRSWPLELTDIPGFILGLTARDEEQYWLSVDCDSFAALPPVWRWYNPETQASDETTDRPKGSGGYFHASGRICAPWNRIAYKQVDQQGPHGDWELGNWKENPYTGACVTLAAMALRMAAELNSSRYEKRTE